MLNQDREPLTFFPKKIVTMSSRMPKRYDRKLSEAKALLSVNKMIIPTKSETPRKIV